MVCSQHKSLSTAGHSCIRHSRAQRTTAQRAALDRRSAFSSNCYCSCACAFFESLMPLCVIVPQQEPVQHVVAEVFERGSCAPPSSSHLSCCTQHTTQLQLTAATSLLGLQRRAKDLQLLSLFLLYGQVEPLRLSSVSQCVGRGGGRCSPLMPTSFLTSTLRSMAM
jgi:hypothetical protein